MNRRTLLLFVALILAFSGVAYAAGVNGAYKGKNIVRVTLDGKTVKPEKVPGYLEDGYTMVPLGMLRQMGITVEWNQKTLTANVKLPPPTVRTVPVLIQSQLEELSKAVYLVHGSTDEPNKVNQGSGFIIDGKLITAFHVGGKSQTTRANIDGVWQSATQYDFADDFYDFMGFKVTGGKSLPYSTTLPQVNDPVYSIGYPDGKLTINEGVVTEVLQSNGGIIRHSATTSPGFSGGALLNGRGEVIGLNMGTLDINGTKTNSARPISAVINKLK